MYRQSKWTFFTVVMRSLRVLAVFKLFASFFGAPGIALLSHFQNLIALFTQIPDQGTNLAIIREFNTLPIGKQGRFFFTALVINLGVFMLITVLVIINTGAFTRHFDTTTWPDYWLPALLFILLFILLHALCLAVLYANKLYRLLFFLTVIHLFVLLGVLYTGIHSNNLGLAMLAFALGHGLSGIAVIAVMISKKIIPLTGWTYDKGMMHSIAYFMVMAIGGVLLGTFVDFFVRDFALGWFGVEETGYWQAQVRLSDSYRAVFLGTIGVVFYSGISSLLNSRNSLRPYLRHHLYITMILAFSGLLLVWLLRDYILVILYSDALLPAGQFIHYQLLADFFALPSFLLVYLLAARRKTWLYLKVHFFSALSYILLIIILTGWFKSGIAGLPLANALRYCLFLIILILSNRKYLFGHG